jgi:hypothetical protein
VKDVDRIKVHHDIEVDNARPTHTVEINSFRIEQRARVMDGWELRSTCRARSNSRARPNCKERWETEISETTLIKLVLLSKVRETRA